MANKKRLKKAGKGLNFKLLFYQITGLILIVLGVFLLGQISYYRFENQLPRVNTQAAYDAKPQKLYIPKINKNLAISNGVVTDNRWTISETGVSYLTSSAIPGRNGNSVIYGHNKNDILGYLPQVVSGDSIFVIMKSGDIIKYQVFETKQVSPNQVEILNNTPDNRLTIYTCSGFLDQARFVAIAKKV